MDEFRSPLVVVLLAAALVLVAADESEQLIDAGLIGLIVLLNAGLGFTQNLPGKPRNRVAEPAVRLLRDGASGRTLPF